MSNQCRAKMINAGFLFHQKSGIAIIGKERKNGKEKYCDS